jgi:RES domain-containing protein
MNGTLRHDHVPIYRVVRRSWADPIDASFSRRPGTNNRWNTREFPALYCCCSGEVAKAVANDVFRVTGSTLADLQEGAYPQLVEIQWQSDPVDMTVEVAIVAAGFPRDYPIGVEYAQTQGAAVKWHAAGATGVVCRSASMSRLGFTDWRGDHAKWGEIAIYPDNCGSKPALLQRRSDLDWL